MLWIRFYALSNKQCRKGTVFKMKVPFFSILVPVCNQEGNMSVCVDSLKNQTFQDFEVIMVDDGSKDNSYNEMKAIAQVDSRFQVYQHETNQSLLAARYTGMQHASGDYILFLDSDDYYELDTLESLQKQLVENPVDVLRFGFQYEPGDKWYAPESEDPLNDTFLGKIPPAIWKNCYSKSVIEKTIKRSESFYCNMGEDVCLSAILLSNAASFSKTDRIFHHYVLGNGMSNDHKIISREKFLKDMKSVTESANHFMRFMEEYNTSYLPQAQIAKRTMLRFTLFNCLFFSKDLATAVSFLNEINSEEFKDLYEFGCNQVLSARVKKENGIEVDLRRMIVED